MLARTSSTIHICDFHTGSVMCQSEVTVVETIQDYLGHTSTERFDILPMVSSFTNFPDHPSVGQFGPCILRRPIRQAE